jgi:hypothetical protein
MPMPAPASPPAVPRALRKGAKAVLRAAELDRADFDARSWSLADAACLEAVAGLIRRGLAAREPVPRSERLDRELARRADATLAAALAAVVERTDPED